MSIKPSNKKSEKKADSGLPSKPGKPKIAHRKKARSLLVQALYQWQLSDSPIEIIEAEFRSDNTSKIDWEYFHEVLVQVVSRVAEMDKLLSPHLDRKLSELTPVELALLRMGCFELAERHDVPYKVVINESIDLAKKFGASETNISTEFLIKPPKNYARVRSKPESKFI
jgi:transcription antitermination protein NusB